MVLLLRPASFTPGVNIHVVLWDWVIRVKLKPESLAVLQVRSTELLLVRGAAGQHHLLWRHRPRSGSTTEGRSPKIDSVLPPQRLDGTWVLLS